MQLAEADAGVGADIANADTGAECVAAGERACLASALDWSRSRYAGGGDNSSCTDGGGAWGKVCYWSLGMMHRTPAPEKLVPFCVSDPIFFTSVHSLPSIFISNGVK